MKMKLATLRLDTVTAAYLESLTALVALVEEKEDLLAQVAKIDARLAGYESGGAIKRPVAKPGKQSSVKAVRRKRAARGSLKAAIIALLKRAGESGMTAKAIAARLGIKSNRVFVWFNNTGSKIKQIKKAGPGKFAWREGAARFIRPSPAPKPTPKPKPRPVVKPKPAAKPAAPVKREAKAKAGKPGASIDRKPNR